jgi:hypothetical protein
VQTHHINVSRARDMAQEIRHELFVFPEVLDVYVTGRPDWLVVVSRGRPRPAEWLRALRAVGYDIPPRRHAVAEPAEADRPERAAAPASPLAPVWTRPGDRRVSHRPPAFAAGTSTGQAGQP